ncbi:MAG: fibronectin type III domain-containing protein, partial [Gemmatimonadales bacterium]|nr:fibronectin type III domain-containing protein [Gemmatimonadales bacterium]
LASLLTHRQSVAGGDHRTAVIDVQDVYDEFTFGIEDPQAIREFMIHAFANWTPAPRYLLLVGDGTRDYKNFYGHAESRQLVPPQMYDISVNTQFGYYPSDTWFTAVAGMDDLPDATVGRIPAHNLAEAEEVFRKIVQYETGPNPVSWSGRACLVSEWESTAFTDPHDQVYADWFASGPQIAQKVYETSNSEAASTEANQRIDQCVNAGAALLSFAGHGSYRSWGKTFTMFETYPPAEQVNDDLNDIQAGTPLSFHVHANCITGHFPADTTAGSLNDNWYSFLEDWLLTPGKGVVGGLAPSHLTYLFELDTVLQPFYGEIFGKHKERRVEVLDFRLRSDFDAFNNAAAVRSFILQGDPALRLRVPAPPKPEILSIESAGSGQLLLSWTAVPGVATYRVYRTTVTGGNYQRVAAGLTGTEFLDQGLDNCREYYYYVVGVDADGYESAWSNYNETCNGDRSDCRWGTPQNPNPPAAPVLDSVDDPLTGGRLRVTWHNPNSDANQVVRYRIRWRRMPSGAVEGEQTVGPAVFTTIVGSLENKVEYGVTVSAEHCSGQGPASNERTGIPHRVFGVDPPKAIGDLRVTKVDDASDGRRDLLLEWSAPTETVWGLPGTSVQRYEVHGSSMSPRFPVNASTLLPPAPGLATNWNHEDQGYLTSEDWYYLVVAVDAEGETSAGGIELPAAVSDLRVRRTGGQLALSWTAVSSTMEGDDRPLTISAYNVYGRNSVLPRTECGPVNRLLQTPSPGAYVPEPSGSLYTYQVLAEDSHGTESVW